MSREVYTYKQKAIAAAKQLYYTESVIKKLKAATTEIEISRIMKTAREAN